jgi:hypothetical protein
MVRPRLVGLALCVASLALVAATPRGLRAEADDPVAPLLGRYVNVAADGGRGVIAAAVDSALEDANLVLRTLARGRILDNYPSVHRLALEREGEAVRITFDDARAYRATLGGAPSAHRSPDGTAVRVRYSLRGARLVEVVDSGRGHARTTYAREGDLLVTSTTIASPHLPERVHFRLRFRPE